jgi:hypothetical protein
MLALGTALILAGMPVPAQDQSVAPFQGSAPRASVLPPTTFKIGAPIKWTLVPSTKWNSQGLTALTAFFPERAMRLNKSGHVKLACERLDSARLKSCVTISEDVPGFEFALAATKMAGDLVIDDSETMGADDWVLVSVNFLSNDATPGYLSRLKVEADLKRLILAPASPEP